MTKLKELKQKRMQEAQGRRDQEIEQGKGERVENPCGCMVLESDRYWVSPPIPLLQMQQNGKDSKLILRTVQCNSCMRSLGGRTEVEPMIHLAR